MAKAKTLFDRLTQEEQVAVAWEARNHVDAMMQEGRIQPGEDTKDRVMQICESIAGMSRPDIDTLVREHRTAMSGCWTAKQGRSDGSARGR